MTSIIDSVEQTLKDMSKEMEKVKNTDDLVLFAMAESVLIPLRYITYELKRKYEEQKKFLEENKKLVSSNKHANIVEYIKYNQKINQRVA